SFTLGPAPRAATSFSYRPKWRGLFRLNSIYTDWGYGRPQKRS
ncbi:8986_t:CDS:1, partial [Ambispora gerdemannii]